MFAPMLEGNRLVREISVAFEWHSGFAASQKQKNVAALHDAASALGLSGVLEVSTKSDVPLGVALSAFNLHVGIAPNRTAPVENAYQASKVFEGGGPFTDLYAVSPRDAKRDERLSASGTLIRFQFGGKDFPLQPLTAFYDWLYLRALVRDSSMISALQSYAGFTDIEFNPAKSFNCQARACAAAVALSERGELRACAKSFSLFVSKLRRAESSSIPETVLELPL